MSYAAKNGEAPTVFDLFAGCGGLSTGLSQAGFCIKWANEYWNSAANTYEMTHLSTKLYRDNAADLLSKLSDGNLDSPQPGQVDVIVGGPPCQGFSGFNRHRQPDDPRNSMLEIFLRFVDHLKPSLVLLENVPGLLTIDDGGLAELLISSFHDIGYECKVGLLQAGYYGLPQNRWRTFIFAGTDYEALPDFPEPTHQFERIIIHGSSSIKISPEIVVPPKEKDLFWTPLPTTTVADAISDLPSTSEIDDLGKCRYASKPQSDFQRRLRGRKQKVTDHKSPSVKQITQERIDALPHSVGAGWLDLPDHLKPRNLMKHGDKRYANRYGRLDWNGVFNTILTRPHPYWSRVIHPNENRLVTARECARAQSFDDSIEFSGSLSDRYKQIGNAVPPMLAAAIGIAALKSFQENGG